MSRPIDWEPTPPWMEHAACKGLTSLFFPGQGEPTEPAKAVCATCAVADPCTDYGLLEKHGIYGGLSERERRRLRRARRTGTVIPAPSTRKPAKCGTASGRNRHLRLGEPVCDLCRVAHNEYKRALHRWQAS